MSASGIALSLAGHTPHAGNRLLVLAHSPREYSIIQLTVTIQQFACSPTTNRPDNYCR